MAIQDFARIENVKKGNNSFYIATMPLSFLKKIEKKKEYIE